MSSSGLLCPSSAAAPAHHASRGSRVVAALPPRALESEDTGRLSQLSHSAHEREQEQGFWLQTFRIRGLLVRAAKAARCSVWADDVPSPQGQKAPGSQGERLDGVHDLLS